MSIAHYTGARRQGTVDVRTVPLAADELLRALLQLHPARRAQILDSGGARGAEARFLIAGFDPFETIEAHGEELRIQRRDEDRERTQYGSVISLLDARLASYRVKRPPHARLPAIGACIATFSYEMLHRFERLRSSGRARRAGTSEPDAALAFYDTLVVHDYRRGETEVLSVAGPKRLEETCDAINAAALSHTSSSPDLDAPPISGIATSNFSRDEYIAAVRRIKEHIVAGDIYQANLTQQFNCPLAPGSEPEHVFMRLRRDHPASFAAFLRRREDTVVSASPERFLRVEANVGSAGRRVEAWPIKGTRPRGQNPAEDARLRAELQTSEKDRAENIMIVDLMRNDLGRVCQYGSVEVAELCEIQEHPTLFHLVSKVRGRLREGVTPGELLRATFPSGSITGAPKIRAMEIIDDIETAPRGLSMGAIGYFSFDGSLDLNVAIRTMTLARGRVARFNVGGGIVADSDPALEYEESLVKAQALLHALGAVAAQHTDTERSTEATERDAFR